MPPAQRLSLNTIVSPIRFHFARSRDGVYLCHTALLTFDLDDPFLPHLFTSDQLTLAWRHCWGITSFKPDLQRMHLILSHSSYFYE